MEQTKNLCAQIPLPLFEQVRQEREQAEETTSQYIIRVLTDYYNLYVFEAPIDLMSCGSAWTPAPCDSKRHSAGHAGKG